MSPISLVMRSSKLPRVEALEPKTRPEREVPIWAVVRERRYPPGLVDMGQVGRYPVMVKTWVEERHRKSPGAEIEGAVVFGGLLLLQWLERHCSLLSSSSLGRLEMATVS